MPVDGDPGMIREDTRQLRPEGKTSLYDSIAAALVHFRDGRGQRALVLLSDGVDTASYASFRQAVDLARRGGVTIYTIGLGLSLLDEKRRSPYTGNDVYSRAEIEEARGVLAQIASETGGRAFLISRTEELEAVYDLIGADLRSRYLLAYQTARSDGEEGVRPVEVRVKRRGLRVRTVRRYSP
jgi:VWFA-related protein